MTAFSHAPLQVATLLGFAFSLLAFVAVPVIVALRLTGHYQSGFATLTIIVLLLGGIQLIAIGVLGEYLARTFDEVKRRPLYLVREPRERGSPPLTAASGHRPSQRERNSTS